MLITSYNEKIINEKLHEYLKTYGDYYSSDEVKYILKNFNRYLYELCPPDILLEIYSELELTHKVGDFYQEHFDRINRYFGLDKNILEIGSGYMPSFAHKIASHQQKIEKGTITLYEPLLIENKPKYSNMTLHKSFFKENTKIKDYDLLIGIFPCEATSLILEKAIQEDKDFYIAMCGCTHSSNGFYSMSPYMYQQTIIDKANNLLKQNGTSELIVEKLPEDYVDFPVLHNKRIK